MASQLNLRQYQDSILARLDAALHSDTSKQKTFLGVVVGGINVLIDMRQIGEVLPMPEIYPAPNSQHWFLGSANVRGNLYAISDLGAFLQAQGQSGLLSQENKKSELRIVLLQAEVSPHTALMIDRLIGLRGLENLKNISNANTKNQADEKPCSICFFDDEYEDEGGNLWRMLDCQALVNLKAFVHPGLA
jgi:twitching motility protein PilI